MTPSLRPPADIEGNGTENGKTVPAGVDSLPPRVMCHTFQPTPPMTTPLTSQQEPHPQLPGNPATPRNGTPRRYDADECSKPSDGACAQDPVFDSTPSNGSAKFSSGTKNAPNNPAQKYHIAEVPPTIPVSKPGAVEKALSCCFVDARARIQVRRRIQRVLENICVKVLLTVSLVVALFAGSLWVLFGIPDDPGDIFLDVIMTFVLVLFLFEIVANCIANTEDYPLSTFFWMDVVGTVSMVLEISYLLGNTTASSDAALLRAARAAKLGARGARFAKMVKMMSEIAVGAQETEGSRDGESHEVQVISKALMLSVSTKVSFLVICMVLVLPFFDFTLYLKQDYSVEAWTQRLENDYKQATLSSVQPSEIFRRAVEDFNSFYENEQFHPYKLEGFDENVIVNVNGVQQQLFIPGQSLINRPEPLRKDYIAKQEVTNCLVDRPGCNWNGKAKVYFSFEGARKLEAGLNMATIAFVMLAMVVMSFDLSRTLDALLDIEKVANLARIYMTTNIVDETAIADMSNEDRGVMAMMHLDKVEASTVHDDDNMHMRSSNQLSVSDSPFVFVTNLPAKTSVINSWDLDVLAFEEDGLSRLVLYIFFDSETGHVSSRKYCDPSTFQVFYDAVKAGYNDLPYHNFTHACDVLHVVYRLLNETRTRKWATVIDIYALTISALCHDVGHAGRTNPFLVEVNHELALRYNDKSPLENMHCATLFQMCSSEESNIFFYLDKKAYVAARKVCISAILHTDNAHHFEMVKDISLVYEVANKVCDAQAASSSDFESFNDEFETEVLNKNKLMFLQMFLHFADISNPLKPFSTCRAWALRVLDEFFAQGDAEKTLNLPVGMLNDRDKVNKAGSQHGFINFLVSPLVLAATRIFHPVLPLVRNMADNMTQWKNVWIEDAKPTPEEITKREADVQKVKDLVDAIDKRSVLVEKRRSMNSFRKSMINLRVTVSET